MGQGGVEHSGVVLLRQAEEIKENFRELIILLLP